MLIPRSYSNATFKGSFSSTSLLLSLRENFLNETSMNIAQGTSSFMVVTSSHRASRSWEVGCCMEQYNPPPLRKASSHAGQAYPTIMTLDMTKERIRKLFNNVELSVSSYDTAWVAMVPSPNSPKSPCFPDCLNWLIDNQLDDGSWGLLHHHPQLLKDNLSSTLACILALKRWNVGKNQINKGLHFIESNFASVNDKNQVSPIGFDIIFPSMIEYAKDLNIKLPLNQTDLNMMLHERELVLRRCHLNGREAYLAYVSEGLGNFHDWNMVMKYQMKNGSLFNSPSATAAAVIHHQNAGCLNYLSSLLEKFGNAVPTVYPLDLYMRLCMVDTLERLGITRHFTVEIQHVLDKTYRCWVQGDMEIFMNVVTCALAFRILRSNGYEVSSDPLAKIIEKGGYMNSLEEPSNDVHAALEVYKASQLIYQEELASFPSNRLSKCIHKEDSSLNLSNEDYLLLALKDFNACQSIYREEIKDLKRWNVNVETDCISEDVRILFLALKDAICWMGDKAFKWQARDITSHVIEIWVDLVKSMLKEAIWARDGSVPTINEYIENGYVSFALGPIVLLSIYFVGPKLSKEIVQSSEYHKLFELMSTHGRLLNDIRTFKIALEMKLSLIKMLLTNCVNGMQREMKAGQLNVVPLYMIHGKNGIVEDEVVEEIKMLTQDQTREMMKLVMQTKGSIVPRVCKDAFLNMCNILNHFYATDDGYTGNTNLDLIMKIIYEPVSHQLILQENL
ncbi:hypothetical protein L2E82_14344 [Cichorium intybus]|uniref:Uncharacterized protein n=1 Tax=Cichorium intybus TaxID=13427 RepID=A0ACB9F101_CICIN|nr:hypothetical protein L2E82_14344 [Cichorium intybus]